MDLSEVCIYDQPLNKSKNSSSVSSSSTYSSKSSNTSIGELSGDDNESGTGSDIGTDECSGSDDDTSTSSSSCEEEEDIFCSIFDFPVQMITMEKCENTLDYLMEKDLLHDKEWTSCLFQIIVTLSLFQKNVFFYSQRFTYK